MTDKTKRGRPQPVDTRKPSLVPPAMAAIVSLLIPGLGQVLARFYRRGLVIFGSFISIIGLLIWRFQLVAKYDTGIVDIFNKAIYLQPFLLFLTIMVVLTYVWIAVDAFRVAKRTGGQPVGIFFLILVVFFSIGWQIGDIDLVAMVTQADEAGPALGRVLWPWKRAISYPEEVIIGTTTIQAPCADEAYVPEEPTMDGPYLRADQTCGNPSEQGGGTGTLIRLTGYNFAPDANVEIWWEDPIGNEFRQRQGGEYISLPADENGEFAVDIVFPYRLLPPAAGEGPKVWTIQGRQIASVGKAELSIELKLAVEKIIETIFIGMMATLFGIVLALPVSFLAARNLMSASKVTLIIYYLTRGVLNVIRSIEPLIWAIIAVIVVGLGPFAGILALTLHSIAALAKLYSEAIESIDPGPIEAIQATGANWVQTVVYAVIPQVVPPFVSFTIYRWDINIRMSTIIGFVGGGGIGFLLAQWIRLLDYSAAGIAVWFIAVTVAILDYVSAEIRARFV